MPSPLIFLISHFLTSSRFHAFRFISSLPLALCSLCVRRLVSLYHEARLCKTSGMFATGLIFPYMPIIKIPLPLLRREGFVFSLFRKYVCTFLLTLKSLPEIPFFSALKALCSKLYLPRDYYRIFFLPCVGK